MNVMAEAQQPVQPTANPATGDSAVVFSIDKIYVKDLSLENPSAPQSFMTPESPQLEVGLRSRAEQVQPDLYECVLTITVTARVADKTVFLVEVAQAGLFGIRGIAAADAQPILAVHCPTVLFPYARESVADATTRAGFPPVQLAPINFEMLYQQQLAQLQQQAAAAVTS